jgi:ketosteroid isomerase-like protein
MQNERESFGEALERFERAAQAVYQGDHRLWAEMWSHADDASLFGAFGPAKVGWDDLDPVFPWVASRYRSGTVQIEYVVRCEVGDVAYTVGYERSHVSIDGQEPTDSVIRVTQVYRRENGRWMLTHRHGDFTPPATIPPAGG